MHRSHRGHGPPAQLPERPRHASGQAYASTHSHEASASQPWANAHYMNPTKALPELARKPSVPLQPPIARALHTDMSQSGCIMRWPCANGVQVFLRHISRRSTEDGVRCCNEGARERTRFLRARPRIVMHGSTWRRRPAPTAPPLLGSRGTAAAGPPHLLARPAPACRPGRRRRARTAG